MSDLCIAMTSIGGWGPLPSLVQEMSGRPALRRLLRDAGIPAEALHAPHHRIPLSKMVQVFDAAARAVGEDDFGLRVGRATHLATYGDWAAYSASARTLGEGLERVCRAIWVHESHSRMWLQPSDAHLVWRYSTALPNDLRSRAFSDHLLKPMLDFLRAFLGPAWEPDWLELDYPRPRRAGSHAAVLNGPVLFERPSVGLPVRRADLATRMRLPELLPRPITSLDLRKYRLRQKADPLEQMIELIDLCLLDSLPDLENAARLLNLGPRTLQRRLARHGTPYRVLLEEARKRRATSFLRETDRPIKTIAADLGYQEAANFTRAFRVWYGITPAAYRASSREPRS